MQGSGKAVIYKATEKNAGKAARVKAIGKAVKVLGCMKTACVKAIGNISYGRTQKRLSDRMMHERLLK